MADGAKSGRDSRGEEIDSMQPYNPYSPPTAPRDLPTMPTMRLEYRPALGLSIKWVYLAVSIVEIAAAIAKSLSQDPLVDGLASVTTTAGFVAWAVTVCTWIHRAWSSIAPEDRRGIDPTTAVVRLFIPIYSLYWVFAGNLMLSDILNRTLERIGSSQRIMKALAVFGVLLHFASASRAIPSFVLPGTAIWIACHAIWFTYMVQCDQARMIIAQNSFEG